MSETHESWIERVGRWGLPARAGFLMVLFLAFLAVAAPLSGWLFGRVGVEASVLAAAVCCFAGLLALAVTTWVFPPTNPAAHVLGGMLIRMSLPLLVCLLVTQRVERWAAAGFAWWLIAAFCLGLAAETVVSVGQLRSSSNSRPSGTDGTTVSQADARDTGDGTARTIVTAAAARQG